jgi:hypothetical protein
MRDDTNISETDLADVAALADGSLAAGKRAAVEAKIAASPDLAEELDRQRRAVSRIADAQGQVRAPAELRARVGAERVRRGRRGLSRRLGLATGGALAAAAAVVALILSTTGVSGTTILAEAAATHSRPADGAPPPARTAALLDLERFGVTFPNWSGEFEWDAIGTRTDRVRDRDVATVSYVKDGASLGYSVVSGDQIAPPNDARTQTVNGVEVSVYRSADRTIAVFDRGDRTCVMSAVDVPEDTLVKLAAWAGDGAVAF